MDLGDKAATVCMFTTIASKGGADVTRATEGRSKVVIGLLMLIPGTGVGIRQSMDFGVMLNTAEGMLEVVIWLMVLVADSGVGIGEIMDLWMVFNTAKGMLEVVIRLVVLIADG